MARGVALVPIRATFGRCNRTGGGGEERRGARQHCNRSGRECESTAQQENILPVRTMGGRSHDLLLCLCLRVGLENVI